MTRRLYVVEWRFDENEDWLLDTEYTWVHSAAKWLAADYISHGYKARVVTFVRERRKK